MVSFRNTSPTRPQPLTMPAPARTDGHTALWLFIGIFLVYLSTATGVLDFGDDWSMLYVTRSIVESGGVSVPASAPGVVHGADGHYYSKYGLGQSLLAIPFYVAGTNIAAFDGTPAVASSGILQGTALTYVVTMLGMLASAASASLFFLSARLLGFGVRASLGAALGLAFGTFAWYWARTFMTEPTSMFMLVLAFYAQLRDALRPSRPWLAGAGAALAFALVLRVGNAMLLPGFGVWLLWEVVRSRQDLRTAALRVGAWTLPVAAGIAGVVAYNVVRFGNPTDIGYGAASGHLSGRWWVGLYGVLFSPGRSMFLYAPMLLASAAGASILWRTRRWLGIILLLMVIPYIALHSRLPYWDGGGCWSPRYESTILPFLMLGFPALLDRGLSRAGMAAVALLGVAGVCVQLLGILVPCIPYASKMLADPASADRLIWHPAYAPVAEHARSFIAGEYPLWVAPNYFRSSGLAWLQAGALAAGLLALGGCVRRVSRTPAGAVPAAVSWPIQQPAPAYGSVGAAPAAVVAAHATAMRYAYAHGSATIADELAPEVSIVMPCLNEADTLAACVGKAQRALEESGLDGEIIVADNGSTDGSVAIAERLGARVVLVRARGYGHALMEGIQASHGKYVIMGDADDSYDFLEIPRFVAALRQGYDLVQGCRLPSGGGRVMPGAMPFLHRWWGNPMFSEMARWWFRAPIHDVYCGLRGFTRVHYDSLDQRCTGMEFATEMIIKSSLRGVRIGEVPITLHPDGRVAHAPHLKTFRDGWRTLRFFLMYSPRWLFLVPGAFLVLAGFLGYALAMPGVSIRGMTFDAHTLLFASLAILCGYQSILFSIFAKTFAVSEGLIPQDARLNKFFSIVNLERGLIAGCVSLVIGLVLLSGAINQWRLVDFGRLEYSQTMRWVIPGATMTALGFQTLLSSFFVSILGLRRK